MDKVKHVLVSGDPMNVDLIVRTFARAEALGRVKFQVVEPEDKVHYEPTDSKFVAPTNYPDTKETGIADAKTPKKTTRKKKD